MALHQQAPVEEAFSGHSTVAAWSDLCNCSSQLLKAADMPSTAIKYLSAVFFSFSSGLQHKAQKKVKKAALQKPACL